MAYGIGNPRSTQSAPWKRRSPWWRWFKRLAKIAVVAGVIGSVALALILRVHYKRAQTFDLSTIGQLESAILLYDRHGKKMGEDYRDQKRLLVTIDQVPEQLIRALIAVEDSRFFEHDGVDWIGVCRAVWLNFKAGRRTQGASTITQQLGRQSFGLLEKTYGRKLTEIFLARRIEENFSKEEILEHYLNLIYFGHGFHGVNAAANGYFGKSVSKLNVEEAALICGLIKAPSDYSPLKAPDRAVKARNHVLDRMALEGFLSGTEAQRLKRRPIMTNTLASISRSTHAFHYIREQIEKKLGQEVVSRGGLRVFTTLDLELQQRAERSLRRRLEEVETRQGYGHQTYDHYVKLARAAWSKGQKAPVPDYLQGALIAIDNDDGGIISLVGSRNFQHFQYNCATRARRPAGSAFKPFVFALAFQKGMFPGTIVTDKVMDNKFVQIGGSDGLLGEWAVETPKYHYLGDITARKALVLSKNAASVRLGLRVGLEAFLQFVKAIGIQSEMRPYNSSFLGSNEVTLAELCQAYTIFPNGGLRPKALYIIRKIQAADGTLLYQASEPEADLVDALSQVAAFQTHSCLQQVLTRGTAANSMALGLHGFPAIGGKTGTAYDFTDTWFVGYDSAITCGVWTGFINPKTIYSGAFGNEIALPIWIDFMNASTRAFKPLPIEAPEGGRMIEICTVSGQPATDACYEDISPSATSPVFARTTAFEFIPKDFHLRGTCGVHAPHSAVEALRREMEDIMHGGPLAFYSGGPFPQAVALRESTVIGPDPYGALQPATRATLPKANPKLDGDKRITQAKVVKELPIINEKGHARLPPPQPIELTE